MLLRGQLDPTLQSSPLAKSRLCDDPHTWEGGIETDHFQYESVTILDSRGPATRDLPPHNEKAQSPFPLDHSLLTSLPPFTDSPADGDGEYIISAVDPDTTEEPIENIPLWCELDAEAGDTPTTNRPDEVADAGDTGGSESG